MSYLQKSLAVNDYLRYIYITAKQYREAELKGKVMNNYKLGYYTANCQNGVTFFGEDCDRDVDILTPSAFLDSLWNLGEKETIFTACFEQDLEVLAEIDSVYGIQN